MAVFTGSEHKGKTQKERIKEITEQLEAGVTAVFESDAYKALVPYSPLDQKYEDLRFLSSQYSHRISMVTKSKIQLINLLDESMPGITKILALKSRNPEKCMLLQFVKRFHSFDYLSQLAKLVS